MRVAVVCPYDLAQPGGVQQLTLELVARLRTSGHDAWLVGPGPDAPTVGSTIGVRSNSAVAPVALAPGVLRRVPEALRGAEVVHIHEPLIPLVSLAALRSDLPKVMTFHADAPAWVSLLYRSAGRLLDRTLRRSVLTAVSGVAAAAIPGSWGPVEVIPNALDVAAYRGDATTRRPHRVTFLGRDDPRKGLDVLLRAWEAVVEAVPSAELVVIGASRDSRLPGVRFVGWVDEAEKRRLLASAAVHAAPNTGGESFGIIVAEAMAAGAAVVASDIAAFQAVMAGNGLHTPVGDSGALAGALVRLLTDPDERRRLGEAGRRRAAAFDWPAVLERYVEAYRRAVG